MFNPADLCPKPSPSPPLSTQPHAAPIFPASVWACESPEQADLILAGREPGYVYQRDGNPNASMLAQKLCQLHAADRGAVTGSGMAALAAATLAHMKTGDHAVIGSRMYGKTAALLAGEGRRLGMQVTAVDTCNPAAVAAAIKAEHKAGAGRDDCQSALGGCRCRGAGGNRASEEHAAASR
jgi:O-acetylhomoserine/O-acetylserine sulfhydrylase-like pyridoxal-dependent enzyme